MEPIIIIHNKVTIYVCRLIQDLSAVSTRLRSFHLALKHLLYNSKFWEITVVNDILMK